MVVYNTACALVFAGFIVVAAGLQTATPVSKKDGDSPKHLSNDGFHDRKCLKPLPKDGCTDHSQCCKDEICYSCSGCTGGDGPHVFGGSCIPKNAPLPSCAPPPPCTIVCPANHACSSDDDCCSFQKCLICPTCLGGKLGSQIEISGRCVTFQRLDLSKPLCPLSPLPQCRPGECEKSGDCGGNEFCHRCAKCIGPDGPEYDGPGSCFSKDGPRPGCPRPGPCRLPPPS